MKTDLIGSRGKADRLPGRPPTPSRDPRLEASKEWSTSARHAAREAFAAASSSGATREEAIEAGYRAGLRRVEAELEASASPAGELAEAATALFGARVVDVLPAGRDRSALEERCFERLFPDPPPPASVPAPSPRSGERDEEKAKREEASRKALAGKLGKAAPGQGNLFASLDARSA
jgi:hypothetical protein